jgi:hypothetical protein
MSIAPLKLTLALGGLLLLLAPAASAQITPVPRDLNDSTVGYEDPTDNHTSTVTTSFTSSVGASSVSVTYTNETTGETTSSTHGLGGAHSGSYKDQLQNTKKGDKVTVVKEYELSNGQTVTRTSHITIQ